MNRNKLFLKSSLQKAAEFSDIWFCKLPGALASLYCVAKGGTSCTLMTGGGFHLPVSASDFGA
jgi:hypothetical protein